MPCVFCRLPDTVHIRSASKITWTNNQMSLPAILIGPCVHHGSNGSIKVIVITYLYYNGN